MLVNILVAYSNFPALAFAEYNHYALFPIIASFLYHLSETNHSLQGIPILNEYSSELLIIDRFFACVSITYVLLKLTRNYKIGCKFYAAATLGLVCLLYSEKTYINLKISKLEYLITHSTWHLCAFYCLLTILNS